MKKDFEEILTNLALNGLIYEKTVRKATLTSGAIFLPKRFIGRKFRVLLVPLEPEDVLEEVSKLKEIKEQVK